MRDFKKPTILKAVKVDVIQNVMKPTTTTTKQTKKGLENDDF